MNIVSVRQYPQRKEEIVSFFQKSWQDVNPIIYEDAISHSIDAPTFLPQWYVLEKEGILIGCAGIITNDFISRGDLYPWVCALFISEEHRGNAYGSLLLDRAKKDAKVAGFDHLFLCTEHVGLYEKYGFSYKAQGYHPWGEESRIYETKL